MWKEAGIRAAIKVVPNAQYWNVWLTAPLGATVWAHRPLGVINLALAYRTGVPWNESSYTNPTFYRLLDEAESMPDPNDRREQMDGIEQTMQGEGHIVHNIWPNHLTLKPQKNT